jgi:fused signal recognition particle receptor
MPYTTGAWYNLPRSVLERLALMLRESLQRTRQAFFGRIANLIGATELSDQVWEEVEALLIQADLGVATAQVVTSALRKRAQKEGVTKREQLMAVLKAVLLSMLPEGGPSSLEQPRPLTVILIVGVNGTGKTTTIAKLAQRLSREGRKVMLAAADTFRAAAVEQLQVWGERLGVPVVAGQAGGDAGAVVYDAIQAALARGRDVLLVDTAGRLHTKYNLMEELKKVSRVAGKNVQGAPHEVWLVLDGTTGQNALSQASHFKEAVGVTGVIVTKLDSTARGGMVFAIGHELNLPVRYVGVGEGVNDLLPFDPQSFVDSLFD